MCLSEEKLLALVEYRFGKHHEVQALVRDILRAERREQEEAEKLYNELIEGEEDR